jgi:hypothetical protein
MALTGSGVELMLVSLVNQDGKGRPSSRAKAHAEGHEHDWQRHSDGAGGAAGCDGENFDERVGRC